MKWLRSKWAGGIGIALFCFLGGAIMLYLAVSRSIEGVSLYRGPASDLGLFGFFVGAGLVLYWSNHFVGKPADGVVVSDRGIELHYPSYGPKLLEWADRSFRLRIWTSYQASIGEHLQGAQFWWKPRLFMRQEVADVIIAAARSHGMDVRTVKDGNSTTGEGIVIRPPAKAAG